VKPLNKPTTRSQLTVATSIAHFANDVPLTLIPAVLPILIKEFNLNYTEAGAVITASALLMTSLQAATGYIADRRNRVILLLLGLTTLGVATILVSFSINYVQLLTLGCLLGIGGSLFHPIGYSLLSDAFESGNRGKALGLGSAAGDIAVPVAFATSGLLISFLGWHNLFILWGLIAIIVALVLPFIIEEPRKKNLRPNTIDNSTKKIAKTLIPVVVVMGLAGASYRIASSFVTTYLTDSFNVNFESANLILASMMVAGSTGSIVGGTLVDKLGGKNTVTLEMIMLSILSMGAIYTSNFVFLSTIICTMGFFMMAAWPSFYSVIAGSTSLGARAFTYGILFAVSWGLSSFFPYLSGICADIFGLQVIFVLIGILSLLAALIAYLTFKK